MTGEILKLLSEHHGAYLLDELGAPHRDDLKLRTITVKSAEGRDVLALFGHGGGRILDDMVRSGLVYEAVPLDEKYRRIYRPMPDSLDRDNPNT